MELRRFSRVLRNRWSIVVLVALSGLVSAFLTTALANTELDPLFEAVISVRFDPDEGETPQDLAGEVEDARDLAIFAAQDLLASLPDSLIFADTASGRLFFSAQGVSQDEASGRVRELVRAYLETDPVAGGDINEMVAELEAEAAEVEAQISVLQPRLTQEDAEVAAQHDLLDRMIAAMDERIVALTVSDVGATPQERAANAALRDEASRIRDDLVAERAALPPRPSEDLNAAERLQLRALQRRLDFLGMDYERLALRTMGVAGRGGRVETATTNNLTPEPAAPIVNGALGMVAGAGLAFLALMLIAHTRKEVWLGEDLPIPLLGEIPGRKASALPGPPWYDSTPGGTRKESIQAVRTAVEGALDHGPGALAVIGEHVDPAACRQLAVDLAASFASAGRSVLLVDADYSELTDIAEYNVGGPTLASVLGLPAARTNSLEERVAGLVDEAVFLRADLAVMPSGPTPDSPADAVAGRQLRVFLEQAVTRFDLVVVAAGAARSPAAQVLTQRVGSAVLALAPGKATIPQVDWLVTDLTQQRVRLLGAVMIYGKESRIALSSPPAPSRPVKSDRESEALVSPVSRLRSYPFPGSKRSAVVPLRVLADELATDSSRQTGVSLSVPTQEGDEFGSQVLEALRSSEPGGAYEPVADYMVARVEDIITAVPGRANVSKQLMDVIGRYGFTPLRSVKGHKSVGQWLVEELRGGFGRDQGEELAVELARVLGDYHADPADTFDTWVTEEFFHRHIERTGREPEVWHLTSEAGTVQVLVNGPRLTRERLDQLATDLIRGSVDDFQRQLRKATDADDTETAVAVEARLKELQLFEIALGLLRMGSNEEAPAIYLGQGDEQPHGWAPMWSEGIRPNIAPFQQLGLLSVPVLTEEELVEARPTG